MAEFDSQGRQIPDQCPVEVPIGFRRPPTLQEDMKRFIREELSRQVSTKHEMETFEESEDFGEDEEPEEFYGQTLEEMRVMSPEDFDQDGDPPPEPKAPASKERAPATNAVKAPEGSPGDTPPPVAKVESPS